MLIRRMIRALGRQMRRRSRPDNHTDHADHTGETALWLPALPTAAAAIMGGTLLAAALGGGWWWTAMLGSAIAGAGWVWLPARDRGWAFALVLVAAVLGATAGHARLDAALDAPPHPLERLAAAGAAHELSGVVRDDPQRRGTFIRLDIDLESLDGAPHGGGVRVTLPARETDAAGGVPAAGDRLRLTATLEPLPRLAEFDYAGYLRRHDIYALAAFPAQWVIMGSDADGEPAATLRHLREALIERIDRTFPEPEASLAAGMLLGAHRALPESVEADLRRSGTSHLVVVSGQNIALVLASVVALLGAWVSRRRAALIGLAAVPGYVLLVGAEPPVVRAALMAVGLAVAAASGRRTPGWIALAYAAAAMLLVAPQLAFDAAFQLSLAATAGIMVLADPLSERAERLARPERLPAMLAAPVNGLVEVGAISTAAALAVLPVQAALIGEVSPWQIPANIVVAPLYEATLVAAAAAALFGGIEPFADVIGLLGRPAPALFARAAAWFADLPGSALPVRAPVLVALGWWAGLGWWAWFAGRRSERAGPGSAGPGSAGLGSDGGAVHDDRVLRGLGGSGSGAGRGPAAAPAVWLLGAAAVVLWGAALSPQHDYASVTVLDVGQGLAVLVQDGEAAVLIDTGPPDGAVVRAIGRRGVHGDLDAVVITHQDLDHRGGLTELARRYTIGEVLDGEAATGTRFDIGDRLIVGERTVIEVIAPPVDAAPPALRSDNDRSLVLRVTIGERRLLVTGDIEAAGEAWLLDSGYDLRADVLVVPHHGSATSSSTEFLHAVGSAAAIISVGSNSYGHPHPDVLDRLSRQDIWRTDQHGDVAVHSDGERLWIEQEAS